MAKIAAHTVNKKFNMIVVKPLDFNITCKSGEKTIEAIKSNGYAESMVAVSEGVDSSKTTTGIILNSEGIFLYVPKTIIIVNNKYYAEISSLSNSTYEVILNLKPLRTLKSIG